MVLKLQKVMRVHPRMAFLLLLLGMPAGLLLTVYTGCAVAMMPFLWLGGL
ncbi:MAG: hypothetical protein RR989_05150 [Ruthenibacterium sp.]